MKTRIFRLCYLLIWLAALPLVLLRLAWRARRQRGYLDHVGERFGFYTDDTSQHGAAPTLWIHAVSVGETRATEPLVRAILARWPAHRIVLTGMTPTGRDTGTSLYGGEPRIRQVYLPYDLPFLVPRFLRHFRPQAGIVMETELWPALLHACDRHRIPVMLANGRLSPRSARRYARLAGPASALLAPLVIASQTDDDARRFVALGARHVTTTGSVKFDISPPTAMLMLARQFRAHFGQRPVLLAASTREGEEALLFDAFAAHATPDVLLVVVPRHPQRFDAVAALASARGLSLQRRSAGTAVSAATRVWLGDSMGEMFAYYAASDVSLIGGSWLPFGAQNLIESCAVGTPVLVGPHTFNFAQAADMAVESGAAIREADLAHGVQTALALLNDAPARQRMGDAARHFAAAHRGATERTVALLCDMLKNGDRR